MSRSDTSAAAELQRHEEGQGASEGRVLVVDDDEIELGVLRIVLEEAGFEVATLSSVFDLTRAILRDRPDVILLDLQMPALRGDRVVEILKQYRFARNIPVVMHSSTEEEELREVTEAIGAHDFVRKTGDFDALVATVRGVLGRVEQG